ncbi:MAG: cytochrome c, class I [Gammaproteobacteria bacterium]|jgi:mono/diheme cytochrome c family protein|nr:cytochrome c, class I [Gammaproteobacteria bacterium]MDP7660808.1 cytochrome c, class I [Gammaproteobacteria bacterium]
MRPFLLFTIFLLLGGGVVADPGIDRAEFNYFVHCRGCHGPEGMGSYNLVPNLKGEMGRFLSVGGGREFLVQVPGSANAAVGNEELAELLNWMLVKFSRRELPDEFQPYSAEEVGRLRVEPLMEVDQHRAMLVALMPEQ